MSTDQQSRAGPDQLIERVKVVVPTGETAARSVRYHRPAANNSLDAACNTLQLDGQKLAREHAEARGLQPCQCTACFGVIAGTVTPGGADRE